MAPGVLPNRHWDAVRAPVVSGPPANKPGVVPYLPPGWDTATVRPTPGVTLGGTGMSTVTQAGPDGSAVNVTSAILVAVLVIQSRPTWGPMFSALPFQNLNCVIFPA